LEKGDHVKRTSGVLAVVAAGLAFVAFLSATAAAIPDRGDRDDEGEAAIEQSGGREYGSISFGNFLTECPQAGLKGSPKPLDRRQKDAVEKLSDQSGDMRLNQDYSCFPQDETSISINPSNRQNILGGANDYRFGFGSSGFYASTDRGKSWYDGILPAPSVSGAINPTGYMPSSGDPAVVYDRAGVAYYAQLGFQAGLAANGVFVSRSTNGGFTWSRPRVGGSNSQTDPSACTVPPCAAVNDPRQPGDGVVDFQDNTTGQLISDDKEYITAGPRPAGAQPQCFSASHTPVACVADAPIGVDRLYVSWSSFHFAPSGAQLASQIYLSYSDDQGRSWSPHQVISGSADFCVGASAGGNQCDDNQGSSPTVNPTTGQLWVGFINGDTPDEDQYLVVTSTDGGNTFSAPNLVTPVFDINYPRACAPNSTATSSCTRPDCAPRNAQQRNTLTNSCFRMNSYANIVADRRGGAFADDLYAIVDDNRNGNIASSNVDVFFFRSTDGGTTWIGPTRVNNDHSVPPTDAQGGRDCARPDGALPRLSSLAGCTIADYGNDQFYPWVDVNRNGEVAVTFFDRRLDTNSTRAEWPTSRQRPGNYISWYWGATCTITSTGTPPATGDTVPAGLKQCAANEATLNRDPTGPIDPGPNPVPGQNQTGLPFRNFQISDTPFNLDYAFPRGVFIGDYSNVQYSDFPPASGDQGDGNAQAIAFWTDARNGRSSGGPGGDTTAPSEPGRNPICEQSDVFADFVDKNNAEKGGNVDLFTVTLCPPAAKDKKSRSGDDDHR
jgi:hypothetical protein